MNMITRLVVILTGRQIRWHCDSDIVPRVKKRSRCARKMTTEKKALHNSDTIPAQSTDSEEVRISVLVHCIGCRTGLSQHFRCAWR